MLRYRYSALGIRLKLEEHCANLRLKINFGSIAWQLPLETMGLPSRRNLRCTNIAWVCSEKIDMQHLRILETLDDSAAIKYCQ